MKYGETLRQRSIPEWSHHNVDYDVIKTLIKDHTSPGAGKAVSIPGQGDSIEQAFETQLLHLLLEEHERVNLFVKSKSGEIDRRLTHLAKQVAHLEVWERPAAPGRNPPRRLERYAKLDKETLQTGQMINSLSRFVNVQKLAFQKLIKKYKKWTKSEKLGPQFTKEVSSASGSFWNLELEPLFDQYTALLHIVRAAFEGDTIRSPSPQFDFDIVAGRAASVASRFRSLIEDGDHADFDAAFATLPSGPTGGTATYFIHPECLIELQVLLLQYSRLYALSTSTLKTPTFGSRVATPTSSLRRQSSDLRGDYFSQGGKDDEVGILVLDDIQRFIANSGAESNSTAKRAYESPASVCADARWPAAGEAIVTVGLNSEADASFAVTAKTARLKRKHMKNFLEISKPFNSRSLSSSSLAGPDAPPAILPDVESIDAVRHWLAQNDRIRPLSGICAKRSRFVGLANNALRGSWAVLDRDICMTKTILDDCAEGDWAAAVRRNAVAFPFAVLQVRHEGPASHNLVRLLDASHLTEHARGFTIERHAIWECCRPDPNAPPSWLHKLDKDIRKVPKAEKKRARRPSNIPVSQEYSADTQVSSTTGRSSADEYTSTSSRDLTASSNTSIEEFPIAQVATKPVNGKGKQANRHPRSRQDSAMDAQGKYWSEYDHPEEDEDCDAYYIYVDPNAPVTFPGAKTAKLLLQKMTNIMRRSPSQQKPTEQSALLPPTSRRASRRLASLSSTDSSDLEDEVVQLCDHRTYRSISSTTLPHPHRSTFLDSFFPHHPVHLSHDATINGEAALPTAAAVDTHTRAREDMKRRLYALSLGAALVVLGFIALLRATSKKRFRGEVAAGMVLGIVADLGFALTAVGYLLSRRERVPWWEPLLVFSGFVVVCVGDGMLLVSTVE